MNRDKKIWDRVADSHDQTEKRLESIYTKAFSNTKKYLSPVDTVLDLAAALAPWRWK